MMALEVGHGAGERIGGIGFGGLGESEDDAHHLGDLGLFGASVASDRQLDAGRGVFGDRQARPRADEHRNTASMPELGCCLSVLREEEGFHTCGVRLPRLHDGHERRFQEYEALRKGQAVWEAHDSVRDVRKARADLLRHAPAESKRSWIETEDACHFERRAISSSEMSKSE